MFKNDRIDVSRGIHVNKTNGLSLYVITGTFLILILELQSKVFSGFQNFMQKDMSFNDIVIISVKGI